MRVAVTAGQIGEGMAASIGAFRLALSGAVLLALLLVLLFVIERNAALEEYEPALITTTNKIPPEAVGVTIETGIIDGAAYRIDMPQHWNRGLIVFYHGYSIGPMSYPSHGYLAPALRQFVNKGYAVAQSAFSASGWAIEEGAADSEKLRQYFVEKNGRPDQSFVFGMSMGGLLAVQALETLPAEYEGGLSLCGAIERSDYLLERDFLLLSAFDFYFPDLLGPLYPASSTFLPTAQAERKVIDALGSNTRATESLLRWWGVGDLRTLARMLAFDYYEMAELQHRAGGNPFDTEDFLFTGSGDDHALNAGVKRFAADSAAASYVQAWYTPSGQLTRPLLAVHDIGDPLVPAYTAFDYALAARHAGHAANFVQQFANRAGHCAFTPQEIAQAFDQLLAWVREGKRPLSGAIR